MRDEEAALKAREHGFTDKNEENPQMVMEKLSRENDEIKRRLEGVEKIAVRTIAQLSDLQRRLKLEALSKRYFFVLDTEFEFCRYSKMTDTDFDAHCARIKKYYRHRRRKHYG
ncbi:MAG: hypothetical protein J6K25_04730 [Thermoguttaceae bacterium]|nr:hypothetical protein [Thermoguttaceae bacterium]